MARISLFSVIGLATLVLIASVGAKPDVSASSGTVASSETSVQSKWQSTGSQTDPSTSCTISKKSLEEIKRELRWIIKYSEKDLSESQKKDLLSRLVKIVNILLSEILGTVQNLVLELGGRKGLLTGLLQEIGKLLNGILGGLLTGKKSVVGGLLDTLVGPHGLVSGLLGGVTGGGKGGLGGILGGLLGGGSEKSGSSEKWETHETKSSGGGGLLGGLL
ncbi:keratin, type II cytoskeletal 5-like [Aphidius gifuensis]|uniref:keratin, type II cytoskeletal 5-like n=1 Tax=Aphidius gifuensis TaxID=684658 RepID=UPI001CDCC71B|nr:keratin, type II cytoskeletal 5-like [Aphidius gifuensis]